LVEIGRQILNEDVVFRGKVDVGRTNIQTYRRTLCHTTCIR